MISTIWRKASEIVARNGSVFPRDFKYNYTIIESGENIYLYDVNGNKYIDSCSGAAVSNIGHGNAEVAAVMAEQASKIAFVHSSRFISKQSIELADMISGMAPGDLDHVYFLSGGSEATETAIKLCRQYFLERDGVSNKHKIISRWDSYHGNTLGSLSISGKPALMKKYAPILLDFPHIESAYCYRCSYGLEKDGCGSKCAYALEKAIIREGPENVAGFIFEPVIGSAAPGAYPTEDYYRIIREICNKYDILLIADEVMTGFGRTGVNFGVDHFNIVPDIICFAKGVSSGYTPLGGVIVSNKISDVFRKGSGKFTHGHTYSANPLSCAVGLKVLEIIARDSLIQNVRDKGELLITVLKNELKDIEIVGDIRGLGLQLGIEFVKNRVTRQPFEKDMNLSGRITEIGLKNGIVVYPGSGNADSVRGDNILLTPPFIITEDQVYEIVSRLKTSFIEATEEIR